MKSRSIQPEIQKTLDDLVARGPEEALQVAAYLNGEMIVDAWAGTVNGGTPVDGATLFPIYSTGKGIAATAHGDTSFLWRFAQFHAGNDWADASGAGWDHWLIGDGGHPSKAACSNGNCKFLAGPDGNARLFYWNSGWGG